jgi:hypothetical protein
VSFNGETRHETDVRHLTVEILKIKKSEFKILKKMASNNIAVSEDDRHEWREHFVEVRIIGNSFVILCSNFWRRSSMNLDENLVSFFMGKCDEGGGKAAASSIHFLKPDEIS